MKSPANELNGYLVLQSTDSKVNRHRAYTISISTFYTSETIYMVRTAWGRVSNLYRFNTRLFNSETEAEKYIHAILLLRKRHGYIVTECSNQFPDVTTLDQLPKAIAVRQQLTLF